MSRTLKVDDVVRVIGWPEDDKKIYAMVMGKTGKVIETMYHYVEVEFPPEAEVFAGYEPKSIPQNVICFKDEELEILNEQQI